MRALLASSAAPSRILHSALFVAGLLGVAALLRSVDTIPFWSWTRDEIVHVATGDADCDTLLLGSSRIHYGIQPQAFDARMAELGMPTKSWNLAFCGMRSHDSAALLDWILEHKPKGLKRVLVELHSFDQKVRGGDWMTDMQVEMHTPGQLLPRVRSILLSNHSLPEKLQQFGYVALHTLSNALRAGQGLRLLDDQLADAPAARLDRRSLARRGWRPNGEDTAHSPQADAEHAEFLQNGEKYARIAREKTDDPCRPFLRGGFNLEAFAHQVESARRAGVEILFVVMPTFGYSFRGRDGVDAAARLATVIELDRFADHPELTDLSLYHDQSHLNSQGALAVSRLLAEETARALAEATAPTLTAQWQTTPSLRLRIRVRGLPTGGDAFLGISARAETTVLPDGAALGIALPPVVMRPLQRRGDGSAEVTIGWNEAPLQEEAFAQACVVADGVIVAATPVVAIGPPQATAIPAARK